jgi:hypothetical protein
MVPFPAKVYLQDLEHTIAAKANEDDKEADLDCTEEMKKLVFKRSDFLCFDAASIQSEGNLQLYQYLDPNSGKPHPFSHLEMEVWESWRDYPKIPEIKDLTKGKGLELLAWLVHTFGQRLYLSRLTQSERKVFWNNPKDNLKNILDLLTLDDLVLSLFR